MEKSMEIEAVEIKTEPLDEEFSQINQEEIFIKVENEVENYTTKHLEDIQMQEPEDQLNYALIEPKLEPWNEDSIVEQIEPKTEPATDETPLLENPITPTRSPKDDSLRKDFKFEHTSNCKFCNMFFKSRTSLKIHERNCTQKDDCRLCGQKFITSYALNVHMEKKHNRQQDNLSPKEDPKKEFKDKKSASRKNQCDKCSLKFANIRDLNNHKKKHNTCQQCGENFQTFDDLKYHLCQNVIVKEEIEISDSEKCKVETPTKKIFRNSNSMVVIPGFQTFSPTNATTTVINGDNENVSNASSKSGYSVVTKHTDFEAFAEQMLKGFTQPPDQVQNSDSNANQLLSKIKMLEKSLEDSNEQQREQINNNSKNDEAKIIVDSEGNVFKLLKENFVNETTTIKKEPMDEEEEHENEESSKLILPIPLPLIKDEPQNEFNNIDSTDFLLEELFDRKLKSIAKVRDTSKEEAPSIKPNGLEFKVKQENCNNFYKKSPNNKKQPANNTSKKRQIKLPQNRTVNHRSRRKAAHNQIKEDISENLSPNSEKPRKIGNLNQRKQKCIKRLPTLKDKDSGKIFPSKGALIYHLQNEIFLVKKQLELQNKNDDKAAKSNHIGSNVKQKEQTANLKKKELQTTVPCIVSKPILDVPEGLLNNDLDFEQVIQSNTLPNFKKTENVIKNLMEEYKKAEKVKTEDLVDQNLFLSPPPVAFSSSNLTKTPAQVCKVDTNHIQDNKLSPEVIEARNRPVSLFFPMLDDTQIYNMVASTLHENYRYVWICPMCPRQYTQVRPFKKHLLTLHYENTEQLEGKAFELRPELILDTRSDETFCHLCHVNLADSASLRKHQEDLHSEEDLSMKQKKKPLLHKCYICSKMCPNRNALAEHMKSDCGKNPQYGCNVCDKKFHTKSTLTLHKTMHTGELPHFCKFCQKRFRTRGQLTVHTRTHTGEKPFPCKVCDQRFTHRETLIAHLSRHIDMKRYKCYGCDRFFSCISGLKTHRQTRPETCGLIELNARAVGPRVRVIKGNVIFEPQPLYNARLATKNDKVCREPYELDHNYHLKDFHSTKKISKQVKQEYIKCVPHAAESALLKESIKFEAPLN